MEFQAILVLILSFIILSVITHSYIGTLSKDIENLNLIEKLFLDLEKKENLLYNLQKAEYEVIYLKLFGKYSNLTHIETLKSYKNIYPQIVKNFFEISTDNNIKNIIRKFENLNIKIIENATFPNYVKTKAALIKDYKNIIFTNIVQDKLVTKILNLELKLKNNNATFIDREKKSILECINNLKSFSLLDDNKYILDLLNKLEKEFKILNKSIDYEKIKKVYFKALDQFYNLEEKYFHRLFIDIKREKRKAIFHKNYLIFIFLFLIFVVFTSNTYIIITLIRDRKKWKELSQIDKLTGLPNRQTFLKKIFTTPFNRAYILTLDIVNFKYINELYGHKIGDIVLKDLAKKIKKIFGNVYISRFSGNTFVVFIPDRLINIEEIKKKLESLKIEINLKDQHIEYSPKFTVGVYFIDNLAENKNKWIKNFASTLEYIISESKKHKKGDIYLYEQKKDIRLIIKENLEKQNFLERKIKENNIIAYFQPIVYADTLKPYAFECLARIKDKNKVLPAGMFIDVATESGLVTKIDLKMLEYISKVRDMIPLRLFINLSPKSLYDESIIKKVSFNFKECIFEITEQHIVQNIDLLKQLTRIYKKTFAVDDFGSGFSSLKTVIDLASENIIKYLKIDGSLVQNITNDTYKQHAIEAIVAMAKKLNLKTVAEYVENEETINILRKIGVDFLQGFYIGKPMPLIEALNFIISRS